MSLDSTGMGRKDVSTTAQSWIHPSVDKMDHALESALERLSVSFEGGLTPANL
ncbi:hypothetical protein OHA25_07185 [Nonomuraea sp. NBC_00507]|uniref:hypothetical protein n=1 Tax=Nonomuraea sp. NBC_00507 TaxID=2976002 RepID=UPI002E174574